MRTILTTTRTDKRSRWALALFTGLLVGLAVSYPPAYGQSRGASELTPAEEKVIEFLKDDWDKDFSVTSIDLAMEAVGLDPSAADVRYRLGTYIKSHPELHRAVRVWGWETLALTPDEKLIARALINAVRDDAETPSLERLAQLVGIPGREVENGLAMLARYGILRQEASVGGAGYVVASERYLNWEPRLDFLFHTVSLSSGRQFNTNWAVDFMLLVSNEFSDETVTIEDSSHESTNRIRLVIDSGKLVSAEPESTVVFLGGGWGINNLFSSEEALNHWLERYPELKGRQWAPAAEALETMKPE